MFLVLTLISCKSELAKKHYQSAFKYEEEENYHKAIEELDKAIELNPKYEQAYLDRGIDKSIIGDYKGAIEDMTSLIRIRPNAVEPYVWRSEYKRNLKMFKEALLDIDTAFINKPGIIKRNDEVVAAAELIHSAIHPLICLGTLTSRTISIPTAVVSFMMFTTIFAYVQLSNPHATCHQIRILEIELVQ